MECGIGGGAREGGETGVVGGGRGGCEELVEAGAVEYGGSGAVDVEAFGHVCEAWEVDTVKRS